MYVDMSGRRSRSFNESSPCPRCISVDPNEEYVPGSVSQNDELGFELTGNVWGSCDSCGAGEGTAMSVQGPNDHSPWAPEEILFLEANFETTYWD
jgi:hypothetical protein